MTVLPALVAQLVYVCDAWIIGSAAAPDADLAQVRDFDVLVPFANWPQAAALIPSTAEPNTFGGWKCQSFGREVDVWPDSLDRILVRVLNSHIWHPNSGVRWQKVST